MLFLIICLHYISLSLMLLNGLKVQLFKLLTD